MKKNYELGSNKKLVVYLDEMWIYPTYTLCKCWQDNKTGVMKEDSAGLWWIIVPFSLEKGFVQEHTWFLNQIKRLAITTMKRTSKMFCRGSGKC
jgi:hypothetical protein